MFNRVKVSLKILRLNWIRFCNLVYSRLITDKRLKQPQDKTIKYLKIAGVNSDKDDLIAHQSSYVSIAEFNPNLYVIVNYGATLLFDKENATILELQPIFKVEGVIRHIPSDTEYNPTGVAVDSQGNVYIANYNANNILLGRINFKTHCLVFEKSFSSINSGGPENVSVSEKHNLLVSANYNSNSVTAFNLSTREELWSVSVPGAHGVSISPDGVWATGLVQRKVYFYDFKGKLLQSIGGLGTVPSRNQYMWPTSIFYNESCRCVVISDAHTGYISWYDAITLKLKYYWGGNGPGYDYLHFPYAAMPYSQGIMVLSTCRSEILFLEMNNKHDEALKVSSYRFKNDLWPSTLTDDFRSSWGNYLNVTDKVSWSSCFFYLGYNYLLQEKTAVYYNIPYAPSVLNPGSYLYFLQGKTIGKFTFIFSSTSTRLFCIIDNGQRYPHTLLSKSIHFDSWLSKDNIIYNGGRLEFNELINFFDLLNKKAIQLWQSQSILTIEDIYKFHFASDEDSYLNDFKKNFLNIFRSSESQNFKEAYLRFLNNDLDPRLLADEARSYYKNIISKQNRDVDEYFLVGMLTNVIF